MLFGGAKTRLAARFLSGLATPEIRPGDAVNRHGDAKNARLLARLKGADAGSLAGGVGLLRLRDACAAAAAVKRPAVVGALETAFTHAALTQGCETMGAAVEGDTPHAAVGLVATAANSTFGLATSALAVIPPDDKWCA